MGSVSQPRRLNVLWYSALGAILALCALGLTQCRVADPVTGVDGVSLERTAAVARDRSSCEKECQQEFKRCKKEKDRRDKSAKRDCERRGGDRRDCNDGESKRRRDDRQCSERRRACRAACRYREGGGNGGR